MNERSLFQRALEFDNPADRAAFLRGACDDVETRQRVEALLESHADAGSFLTDPAMEQGSAADAQHRDSETEAILALLDPPTDGTGSLGRFKHYEVQGVIGRGCMGVVLRAFDPMLSRPVAIKVMATQLATNGAARRRFEREARAAAAVRDEHVVSIYEVGEFKDIPYLVMELVAGASLRERMERRGLPGLKEALRIGMQIARGLAAAHGQGLVHRDIKPDNILLHNGVERVKITDFGLARSVNDVSLTRSGIIAGTPQYMAPEQARGEPIDHRADLFGLGGVLYTMCAGRPPFKADSIPAVLKRVCDDEPRPLHEMDPEVPRWLSDLVTRLLAKKPARRFQSATEVAELLGQHLAHLQQPNRVPMPAPIVPRPDRPRTRMPSLLTLVLLLPLLLCCGSPVLLVLRWYLIAEAAEPLHLPMPGMNARLEIVTDDPDTRITVENVDQAITLMNEANGVPRFPFDMPPGRYRIIAKRHGATIFDEVRTLASGQSLVVRVPGPDSDGTGKFTPLFNATSLEGWIPYANPKGVWTVTNGELHGRGGPSFLYTNRDYGDFHLRAEVRVNDGGDGGILFRAPIADLQRGVEIPTGYEAQINATVPMHLKTGSLYLRDINVKGTEPPIPPNVWFRLEIIARGRRFTVKVNDKVTLVTEEGNALIRRGRIALQSANRGTEIAFRNIEIRQLLTETP